MDQAVVQNQDLADRLVAALHQDEFVLYAQLIAPLAPDENRRPFQEILIRFQEEEAKLLHPGSFFPVLEACGLMHYVDRWVVSRVAKWVRGALAIKPDWPAPQNSVNLSAATLSDRYFTAYTRRQLQIAAVPTGTLSFEITCDSAATNVAALLELMAQLGPAGCHFVLARFDGSKAAFELLRLLAPEYVKLSPGLVRILDQGKAGLDKVAGINRECHALGIKTIAEHVESEHTRAQLRALGVDFGQGYAIELPRPLA
jgi:EAL domain-containing protein (putative c-di-GMP-specific phosphodiesterase class I)